MVLLVMFKMVGGKWDWFKKRVRKMVFFFGNVLNSWCEIGLGLNTERYVYSEDRQD
jgi:hypothetical protein